MQADSNSVTTTVSRFEGQKWGDLACWLTPVIILILVGGLLFVLYTYVWNSSCQCGKKRANSDPEQENMTVRVAGQNPSTSSSSLPKSDLITGKDLRQLMNEKPTTRFVVGFFSKRCGHCVKMKPAFQEVMNKAPHVYSLFLDGDEEAIKIGTELGIEGYPTILSFKNGQKQTEFDPAKPRTAENLLEFARQA